LKSLDLFFFQTNVPKSYWSDVVLTATYLINRLPSVILKNMSPLEILKNRKIDLDHIRVFGCTCFVHIKRHDKLDKNVVKAVFLGYSSQKKDINVMTQEIINFMSHEMYHFLKMNHITKQVNKEMHKVNPSYCLQIISCFLTK
jgi:LPS sulfotransferase NodH